MLQLKDIRKEYPMASGAVHALRGVTLGFRDAEFVAVLGPSGCGKTTLLNIMGGLDSYTSGDLVVNGTSTKEFSDAQWDAYRNRDVGFVFQSYNLIPHQTVLANVELALKLSRELPAEERTARAMAALERVGLADQAGKRPSMMSGGQMQRVAIARALVNDPAVILADEPTGALDSETSVQVMDLLKEVASDRLVVMVTHNPELAERYATRTVRLRDGQVVSDSRPLTPSELGEGREGGLPRRTRLRMSTALGLSFQNLLTKKGRTLLTAFAGAIGIIGIALILSISTGMNDYIDDLQKTTMASYPLTISAETTDLSGLGAGGGGGGRAGGSSGDDSDGGGHGADAVYSDASSLEAASALSTVENNLTAFKAYLDDPESDIRQYLGESGVVYSYDTSFGVYAHDPDGALVSADTVTIGDDEGSGSGGLMGGGAGIAMLTGTASSGAPSGFSEMLCGSDGLPSSAVTDSYEVLAGSWPASYDEVVLVVDSDNEVDVKTLYGLGLLPESDYEAYMDRIDSGEAVEVGQEEVSYDDVLGQTLYLLPACDQYRNDGEGAYSYIGGDAEELEGALDGALQLRISGVVRQSGSDGVSIGGTVGYTSALTDWIIDRTDESDVVKAQKADPGTNALTGMPFATEGDDDAAAAREYLSALSTSEKARLASQVMAASGQSGSAQMTEEQLAQALDMMLSSDQYEDVAVRLYKSVADTSTYEDALKELGAVDRDSPSGISIYADSFEDKEAVEACIDAYNAGADEGDQIAYTDYVALITSSITSIISSISYVLIAFVAISLVVSSIMIAIITYISVLERTKEIGVLRALGASKGDVSKIFNAETLIEGLLSGLLGVAVAALLDIPVTSLMRSVSGIGITAALPLGSAGALVLVSVAITLVAGFIPSRIASKKDPAVALRSE